MRSVVQDKRRRMWNSASAQAEYNVEYLVKERDEERLARLQAEYDKEYYAMQLVEHSAIDLGVD